MICNCGECVVCMIIDNSNLDRDEMELRIERRQEIEERHGKKYNHFKNSPPIS